MLNKNKLKKEIQDLCEQLFPEACREALKATYPRQTKAGDKQADKFAKAFTNILAEPFATGLAGAIDYYVKNAQIYGTIITAGSPTTQVASINSTSVPATNGKVPNTLGIM